MSSAPDHPGMAATQSGVAWDKPWGVWASIAWAIVALAGIYAVGFGLDRLSLPENLRLFLPWVFPVVVLVVAVRLRGLAVAPYLAWTLPAVRPRHVDSDHAHNRRLFHPAIEPR
jgi:hypothetical protein